MTDDIEAALEAYRQDRDVPPSLTAIAAAALREFLSQRGYLSVDRTLQIQPSPRGSGETEVSVQHDRYFAEQ